jgi:hypothetical protein
MNQAARIYPRSLDGNKNNGSVAVEALKPAAIARQLKIGNKRSDLLNQWRVDINVSLTVACALAEDIQERNDIDLVVHTRLDRTVGRLEATLQHLKSLDQATILEELARAETSIIAARFALKATPKLF